MTKNVKLFLSLILAVLFFLPQGASLTAQATEKSPQGEVLNSQATFLLDGAPLPQELLDDKERSYFAIEEQSIVISSPVEIGGIYIKFDIDPPAWSLKYLKKARNCGEYAFLHEYQPIKDAGVTELTLTFDHPTVIADIYLLSKGEVPDFVQIWRPAEEPADVLVAVSHSDDDQLFFAGIIPDAVARGAEVQVCYFTNHWNKHDRPHELLNGLYTCGLDRYPIIGELPDIKRSMSIEEALEIWRPYGYSYDGIVEMQVELIRKYRPQIVLGHDVNGEYGHGAHRLNAATLMDAVLVAPDAEAYPALAEEYGVWDVPKTYIHLWKENRIDFEVDKPLEHFGGKTAYQVSQDAFRCHVSQSQSRYAEWLWGTEEKPVTKASEFHMYGPRDFGLWRTTVGNDTVKTDIYENITFYADQKNVIQVSDRTALVIVLSTVLTVSLAGNAVLAVLVLKKRK